MSGLNIQWNAGKPLGILAILAGFAALAQIPMIYHAREILKVVNNVYLPAYITIIIASFIILTTAEMLLYEALLIRMRSFEIKDYRAPFLTAVIVLSLYFIGYYIIYLILKGLELFGMQDPVAQYALCQMISLLVIMILSYWYNKRQTKITL